VENKKKNRYPDKLPYDHNRVLLNALVNGTNSDYINASTVVSKNSYRNLETNKTFWQMDHDPRNPAYIVSQGPMAHTVADFWQMVWEQGSVVIVMLSRYDIADLCHTNAIYKASKYDL
jgi:receptor-type tyrosine-protein phosphatase N